MPAPKVRWTPEEDAILGKHHGEVSLKDLPALLPGRSIASCAGRLTVLGLRRPKEPPWSEADLATLRARFGRESTHKIAEDLGRTPEAVKIKGTRLKLKARKQRLTPRDIGVMMHLCSKQVKRWIEKGWLKAEAIRRKTPQIYAVQPPDLIECLKAHPELWDARRCPDLHLKLGIKSKRSDARPGDRPLWLKEKLAADIRRGRRAKRWTLAEDIQLAQSLKRGFAYTKIAEILGRDESGVGHRVYRLGPKLWSLVQEPKTKAKRTAI